MTFLRHNQGSPASIFVKSAGGFTLVETMVAITLLATALTGPFVAVQNAVQSSYVARDQLVASQLAQEGMEYIRAIRDNNYFANRTWTDGLNGASRDACYGPATGAGGPTGYCVVDPTQGDFHTTSNAMTEVTGTSTAEVLYISANGLYNQQSHLGTPSKFKRLVRVYTIPGSTTEIRVVVQVLWTTGTKAYSVMIVDNLHDWI